MLSMIESALLDHQITKGTPIGLSDEGFRAAIVIFMAGFMERIYALQISEKMDNDTMVDMTIKAGNELRKYIKTYTDYDTVNLFKL